MSKRKIFISTILILLLSISIIILNKFYTYYHTTSRIADTINTYNSNGTFDADAQKQKFPKDSAEYCFYTGFQYYIENDLEHAEEAFAQAAKHSYSDYALPVYLNVYRNRCEYLLTDRGNVSYIKPALNTMHKYQSLENNTDLIINMLGTMASTPDDRKAMIQLLLEYLEHSNALTLKAELKIKGELGALHMLNQNYGDSIYLFSEVLDKSARITDANDRGLIQIRAYEYLGNMYFYLDNPQTAISYYEKAVNVPIGDPSQNAISKVGLYSNKTDLYLTEHNFEKARACIAEHKELISALPEEYMPGANVFLYKDKALLATAEHNFDAAEKCLAAAYEFLEEESYYVNDTMYVQLAECKLLKAQKKNAQAIDKLNELLRINEKKQIGFENVIYEELLPLYKETNQVEKYLETLSLLQEQDEDFHKTLKKDYLSYIEKNYAMAQIQKKDALTQRNTIFLITIILLTLISLVFAGIYIKKIRKMNLLDQLSGLYNRKYLELYLEKPIYKPLELAILMIDIDYFKRYNDTYGHIAGDSIIKTVADILKESTGCKGVTIRYGGEEFLILLENTTLENAEKVCEQIQQLCNESKVLHAASPVSDYLTLSMGICQETITEKDHVKQMIDRADEALYTAKQTGRNKYSVYGKGF